MQDVTLTLAHSGLYISLNMVASKLETIGLTSKVQVDRECDQVGYTLCRSPQRSSSFEALCS